MTWSWRLGRVFGIDVFVHATFLLLLAWIGVSDYRQDGNLQAAFAGVGFVLMVFAIVVMHELGHALTARRFGIRTRDITLLPIGGVARLERMPEKPTQELLVALAGPAVNVVIAIGLFSILKLTGQPIVPDTEEAALAAPLWTRLLWVNVSLALFNLLPAFPMDGGRAVRALLAMRGDYVGATRKAARLGQLLALGLGIVGLFHNPVLVLVAWFVWNGAASESGAVQTQALLSGVHVSGAMITDFHALTLEDTLDTASRALLAGSQVDFPVIDSIGAPVGVLTRHDLVRGLSEAGPMQLVGSAMTKSVALADPHEKLVEAMRRLHAHEGNTLMVVDRDSRLVGLLTAENIGELLLLQEARRSQRVRPA